MDAQFYTRSDSQFKSSTMLLMLVLSVAMTHAKAAEQEQKKVPDAVYVVVEQARLYAGPSSDFYPTGDAKRGTALEVYQRTENGWLGVRPPQGSFSWVPASQAYLLPGGRVIEITDANSVSWIGTDLGSAKQFRWQVQLNVGEQLTVLGEATIKSETDDREALWYKVSPPAGEFRWIEQAAVSKTAPQVTTTIESPATEPQAKSQESSSVDRKEKVAEKNAVQSASFERPATAEARSADAPKSTKAQRPNTGNLKEQGANGKRTANADQWDGWYAFDMNDKGVRTPFLDKLSGRDRGASVRSQPAPRPNHDPLIHDPFSLEMAGGQPKTLPNEILRNGLPSKEQTSKPRSELDSVANKQREWRDPRSLREARLAGPMQGSLETFASPRENNATSNATDVLLASSDNRQTVGSGSAVNTAGYERNGNEMQRAETATTDARANVNWYGLAEGASTAVPNSLPSNSLNVVTSTADVGELQLALNNAVSSSNGPWNLAPLAERARYLIEHGPTAIDRGQARLLLERIDAFQNVSARTQQFTGAVPFQASPVQASPVQASPVQASPVQASPVQSTSYSAPPQTGSAPNSSQAPTATYDATGWLVPVHAAAPDQPTHALTNDIGDVVAYVSPIAGLNLDRYRNQAVGINGLRGYLPQLQAAHIQAQRVSRIR